MSERQIVSVFAFLVSLVLFFAPQVRERWTVLAGDLKARIVVIGCFVITAGGILAACLLPNFGLPLVCPDYSTPGALWPLLKEQVGTALMAAGTVQGMYHLVLKPATPLLAKFLPWMKHNPIEKG